MVRIDLPRRRYLIQGLAELTLIDSYPSQVATDGIVVGIEFQPFFEFVLGLIEPSFFQQRLPSQMEFHCFRIGRFLHRLLRLWQFICPPDLAEAHLGTRDFFCDLLVCLLIGLRQVRLPAGISGVNSVAIYLGTRTQ